MTEFRVRPVAVGDVEVWIDPGCICFKVATKQGDPAELAEHEVRELAQLLLRLAEQEHTGTYQDL